MNKASVLLDSRNTNGVMGLLFYNKSNMTKKTISSEATHPSNCIEKSKEIFVVAVSGAEIKKPILEWVW